MERSKLSLQAELHRLEQDLVMRSEREDAIERGLREKAAALGAEKDRVSQLQQASRCMDRLMPYLMPLLLHMIILDRYDSGIPSQQWQDVLLPLCRT